MSGKHLIAEYTVVCIEFEISTSSKTVKNAVTVFARLARLPDNKSVHVYNILLANTEGTFPTKTALALISTGQEE